MFKPPIYFRINRIKCTLVFVSFKINDQKSYLLFTVQRILRSSGRRIVSPMYDPTFRSLRPSDRPSYRLSTLHFFYYYYQVEQLIFTTGLDPTPVVFLRFIPLSSFSFPLTFQVRLSSPELLMGLYSLCPQFLMNNWSISDSLILYSRW